MLPTRAVPSACASKRFPLRRSVQCSGHEHVTVNGPPVGGDML
jgi:hypothetical protein